MPVTTYTTIDGEIVSQDVNGTVHDLLPDPLGHTVGLIGSGQGIEFEYTYWPYEEVGSIDDVATALRYVGTLGYYSDDYGSPRVYVRARHYRGPYGRWLTVDPLLPEEEPYAYAECNPATRTDSSGLIVLFCYRPVCFVPYKPACHWYLSTSLCGDVGYGTGGVIYGSGNPGSGSWQRPINCVPQTYSAAQEKMHMR